MCRFKSGIILKTRCVIAQGSNDSHSDLLEEIGMDDTTQNAMTKFVRAELLPPNDEWWTDPDTWKVNIDQDIVPDWFDEDRDRYIEEFREAVKQWWEVHVLIDKTMDELSGGYYRLKRCKVKNLLKDVQVMCDSSVVQEMYDSSVVQEMHDSSVVQVMHDSSVVQEMYDSSVVQRMCDSSVVQVMHDSSVVQEMHDSSVVQRMYDSSVVQRMCDSSVARDYANGIIHISSESLLEPQSHENKEDD